MPEDRPESETRPHVIPRTYPCNVVALSVRNVTKVGEKRRKSNIRAVRRTGVYIVWRVQGVFLSGAISMGIGATLRLTVSYLKYIFVDGTFIDVDADAPLSAAIDNIFPVSGREASFPVASPMKKPASQSQPALSFPFASAYSLLMACFMPLYTWLNVYRHRIPTGSSGSSRRLSCATPFPRHRLFFVLSLSLSLPISFLFPPLPPLTLCVRHCLLVFEIFCQFL